jgi:hydroxymethylbilane synthase
MRIGTRGSALALAQARWVAERLGDETELVAISTVGDRERRGGDKARWVSELERALLADEIDVAVHSGKDVPTELPDGLALIAIPARADARDAICGASCLAALAPGARVGTSSLRRAAQLRAVRADLEIVALRGNVDTRLRKLADGAADAIVLALAGLQRLGREAEAGGVLDELVPAAAQGALVLEARPGRIASDVLVGLSDPDSTVCVTAERELVHALGASCNTPVGAHARRLSPEELELRGWVGLPDGSAWLSDTLSGRAEGLAAEVAARMLAAGAGELLAQAEREVPA